METKLRELEEFRELVEKIIRSEEDNDWGSGIHSVIWGQCLTLSLITWDNFGEEILVSKISIDGVSGSHHWNRLPDGTEFDLTRSYLPKDTVIPPGRVRPRAVIDRALNSLPEVVRHYQILRTKIEEARKESGR